MMSMRSRQGLGLKPGLTIFAAGVCVHRHLQPAAPSPLPLPHLLTQSCPGSSIGVLHIYEKVSDVPESRVWFAGKNLTPCRMH